MDERNERSIRRGGALARTPPGCTDDVRDSLHELASVAKRQIQRILATAGFRLCRSGTLYEHRDALARAASRGCRIATIVDVGASDGSWTRMALDCWPNARGVLIEANPHHVPALQAFVSEHPQCRFTLAAASDIAEDVYFDLSDPLGGVASKTEDGPSFVKVPGTSVDEAVRDCGAPGPYLIKMDTHGYELPILKGSSAALKQTQLLVMETYNFRFQADCLRFSEMCDHMEGLGFGVVDLAEPKNRPGDGVLWQMDLYFAPLALSLFQDTDYTKRAGHAGDHVA